jgi:flagellar export protein FliJ
MKSLKQKILKMAPLLKARQSQLEEYTVRLSEIRQSKLNALQQLEHYQNDYINGVESLNQARQSPDRNQVATLERSVDYVKAKWYQSLKQVRQIEEQEKIQLQEVTKAQRDLRSVEILKENYERNLAQERQKHEQKELDELSIQKFNRQRAGSSSS